jgi:hypothetical protein
LSFELEDMYIFLRNYVNRIAFISLELMKIYWPQPAYKRESSRF